MIINARNLYRFSYDYANRLTGAAYRQRVGTAWVDVSKYTEGSITYDLNSLSREAGEILKLISVVEQWLPA